MRNLSVVAEQRNGVAYGTTLPPSDKWALLEYLKTF